MVGKLNKKIIASSLICLFPVLLGSILWKILPEQMVRSLSGYSSKAVVIFVLPVVFLAIHLIYCFKKDWHKPIPASWRYRLMPLLSNLFFVVSVVLSAFVKN